MRTPRAAVTITNYPAKAAVWDQHYPQAVADLEL
jgi:hypothetical protein